MGKAVNWAELVQRARVARGNAHAPYSGFHVGAALLTTAGEIFTGCNVENVSFGLTICAERNAVAAAVANGCCEFLALAIVTDSEQATAPCGACRQVLAEFGLSLPIQSVGGNGAASWTLTELLPLPFSRF